MKNLVLLIGAMAFLLSLLYFGNTKKGVNAAGGDITPPSIVSIDPGQRTQVFDPNDLAYTNWVATTSEQKSALGIGSIDLGTLVQSAIVDLGSERKIFSVIIRYRPEATNYNDVVVQVSSTSDFAEYVTISNNGFDSVPNGKSFKAESNQMGRYIRCLSNSSSVNVINDYIDIAIYRI